MTLSAQTDRVAVPSASPLRSWRPVASLITLAAGAAVITGAFLPWVEEFAGLIPIAGVRGDNGRMLAVGGAVLVAAGIWQLTTGSQAARWFGGLTGFAAAAFSGYLLIQLTATMRVLGGDSMVAARSGPGLAVTMAGALAAFATLLLPPSSQTTFRRERPAEASADSAEAAVLTRTGAAADAPLLAGPLTGRLGTLTALRRGLQISLGVIWLLDAALQYEPGMFGKMFATMVLAPSAAGQPAFVAGPVHLTVRIVAASPVAWNAAFATVQLTLGVGLLFRVTTRAALAGTIAWALSVWWLGEGLGGIFTGTANPLTGAPGGALLYALLAALVWPSAGRTRLHGAADRSGSLLAHPAGNASVAESGLPGRRYARLAWFILWAAMAALMARAPFESSTLTAAGGTHALLLTAVFTAAFAFAAVGVLFPATVRAALITAAIASLVIWVVGEDFGGILSSMATDPNSGPLLLLLAVAFWPARPESAAPVRHHQF